MNGIREIWQRVINMGLSDYLDIAVVAFLIYNLLPMLRTPNIKRIAKTIIAVVVASWLTNVLGLYTINWMLNQFLAIGLLAFVVLFQPEIRRVLDHLGNVKFTSLFSTARPVQEMEAVIAQTVQACEIMSRDKVGALIVFAREHRLDEYIRTGTVIDARVSSQLLLNIFFKNSPLHDGGMVIRDGRVAAAGCVLPLSGNPNLSTELGTRHRAGVGTSEVSDALVVIVSEETGTISVATDGMLKRHLAPETLERLLRNELCPKEDENDGQRGLLSALRKPFRKKEADDNAEK